MNDIVKSGILGVTLIVTLLVSAPFLNDESKDENVVGKESIELKTETDIHIPL